MKKFLLGALFCAISAFGAVQAQSTNLSIGYGGYTQMDATDMHDGGKVNTAWGAVTVAADWQIAPRFRIGPSYTFSSSTYKHDGGNIYYHAFLINARYDYYRNNIVDIYSHLGVGVDVSHMTWGDYSHNKVYYAMQASIIGVEADLGSGFSFYGEAGFGCQGLLQVGFRVKI